MNDVWTFFCVIREISKQHLKQRWKKNIVVELKAPRVLLTKKSITPSRRLYGLR